MLKNVIFSTCHMQIYLKFRLDFLLILNFRPFRLIAEEGYIIVLHFY